MESCGGGQRLSFLTSAQATTRVTGLWLLSWQSRDSFEISSALYSWRDTLRYYSILRQGAKYRNTQHALQNVLLGDFAILRKATISFVMSVCPSAWNNSTPNARISIKFDI